MLQRCAGVCRGGGGRADVPMMAVLLIVYGAMALLTFSIFALQDFLSPLSQEERVDWVLTCTIAACWPLLLYSALMGLWGAFRE